MPFTGIEFIDIRSEETYSRGVGRNNIYAVFTEIEQAGVNNVLNISTDRTIGRNSVYNDRGFGKPHGNIIVGDGAGIFTGYVRGHNFVRQVFTGSGHGLLGIQSPLLGSAHGSNRIYFLFDGTNGKGNVVVGGVPARNVFVGGVVGRNRIANDAIAGYVVYVGAGILPDLNGPETAFSPTLPISVPYPLPTTIDTEGPTLSYTSYQDNLSVEDFGSRIRFYRVISQATASTIYVVVRKRNAYGLVSQNQRSTRLDLTSEGIQFGPIVNPQAYRLSLKDGTITVQATYPTWNLDLHPATHWAVWIALNEPPDSAGQPDRLLPAGPVLITQLGPMDAGTYYVSIAMTRDSDGTWTDVLTRSISVPFPPPCPIPVPGGYELLCDCESETPEFDFVIHSAFGDAIVIDNYGDALKTYGPTTASNPSLPGSVTTDPEGLVYSATQDLLEIDITSTRLPIHSTIPIIEDPDETVAERNLVYTGFDSLSMDISHSPILIYGVVSLLGGRLSYSDATDILSFN